VALNDCLKKFGKPISEEDKVALQALVDAGLDENVAVEQYIKAMEMSRLEGAPVGFKSGDSFFGTGNFEPAIQAAKDYMASIGREYTPPKFYAKVDEKRAARIADEYDRVADPDKAKAIEDAAKAWDNVQIAIKNVFEIVVKLLQPIASLINYISDLPAKAKKLREEGGSVTFTNEFGLEETIEYQADPKAAAEKQQRMEASKKARGKQLADAKAKGGYKTESAEQSAIRAAKEQTKIQENQFLVETQRLKLAKEKVFLDEYQARSAEEQLNSSAKILALEEQKTKLSSQIKYGNEQAKQSKQIEIDNVNKQIEYEKELSKIRLEQIEADRMRAESFEFGWGQAFKRYTEEAQKASRLGEEYFRVFADGMNRAIDEFVDKGKISFKSLIDSMIKDIIRAQLKAQASRLFGSLFGGGGIQGLLGNALQIGTGVTVDDGGVPLLVGKAGGGPVSGGSPYMVGERGPEMFVPNASGMVVPNNQLQAGGVGGMSNVTNYYINAIDTQSFNQALAKNREGVRSAYDSASRSRPASR